MADEVTFRCPRCQGNGCTTWQFPKPSIVHWMLNPGVIVPEIVLGQRLPRIIYFCIRCDQPMRLRQYMHCPAYNTFHCGMLWAHRNAFGHWFGLFCPDCGGRIPALMNIFSMVVVCVTAPVWWPIWRLIRPRWIAFEQRRTKAVGAGLEQTSNAEVNWVKCGVGGGIVFWVILSVFYFIQEPCLDSMMLMLITLPFCLAGGASFGYVMKRQMEKRHKFQAGHCRQCGYSLRGLSSEVCPECGFEFDATDRPWIEA